MRRTLTLTGLGVISLVAASAALSGCAGISSAIDGTSCAVQMQGTDVEVQLLNASGCAIPADREETWVQASHTDSPGDPGAATGKPMSVICVLSKQGTISKIIIMDTSGSARGRQLCNDVERDSGFRPS